ncbi:MAG TPA: efflux RND transporter periplasmic adaptor subunit [Verrucomicrobiae bacterium]|nr:efflux RND transporter periplasmic adaptor subunit [Verrucomicrobiae bacterium]
MKLKSIIVGITMICLGAGIFFLVRSHHSGSGTDDESADENIPAIVSVQTSALKRMTLHGYVTGYGMIEARPATKNEPAAGGTLAAPGAGVVAKVNVVAGQRVQKGDVLVELNSATTAFDYAQTEVARQEKLFQQQNTSLKNWEDARAQLASLEIVAPVSGTVTKLNVKPGQAVDVNTPVAEVIDLNHLAVTTKIPVTQAPELKAGAEIEIGGAPSVTAKLSFVSPAVDPADGTVSAWAALPAHNGLRPGEFVPIKIVTETRTNCLAAPSDSVVTDEKGNSAIALVHNDEATQTSVQTGLSENGWTEVSGTNLNAGDPVVTVGAYGLPAKTQIKIVNPSADATSATNSAGAQ